MSVLVTNFQGVLRRSRTRYYVLALLPLLGTLLVWGLWPTTALEIRAGPEEKLVRSIPVSPGERITYSYVHSVQQTPVDEIIEVSANGHLIVRETVYDMFGAGLPSDSQGSSFSVDANNHKFVISGMSRDMESWPVRVTFTPGQTLEIRGEKIPFSSLAPPTTRLVIHVAMVPRVATLLQ